MNELLMVLGAHKTGTSTIVGILNCHPDIFVSHEWFPRKRVNKYGQRLYEVYKVPVRERIKHKKPAKNAFNNLQKNYYRAGFKYKYVGDKWAILDPIRRIDRWTEEFESVKTIFVVRDVKTWAAHNMVRHIDKCDENILNPLIRYVYYFVNSFKLDDALRVRMEDMIDCPEATVKQIACFLDVDDYHMQHWWNKVGKSEDANKNLHKWWERHKSAVTKPNKRDVSVKLKDHKLWDDVLPIFYKYYSKPNDKFDRREIKKYLERLVELYREKPVKFDDVYDFAEHIEYKSI